MGSDLLPDFRTNRSMISSKERGTDHVEEQSNGGADDRGAEATGGGAQGGGRGAGSGGIGEHDLCLESEVRRDGREPGAIGLRQSPFVQVLSDRKVAAILTQMGRSPDARMTGHTALDVRQRTGSKVKGRSPKGWASTTRRERAARSFRLGVTSSGQAGIGTEIALTKYLSEYQIAGPTRRKAQRIVRLLH